MSKNTAPNDASTTDLGLLADLEARGLIQDSTDRAELQARMEEGPITVYVGFDPTADSLHAGNMVGLLMLRRFQDAGHRVISLAGGATGMVGDPSGKSDERNLLDDDALAANLAGIVPQLRQFLDFDDAENPAKLLDNRAWTVGVPFLSFLRDVGKYVTVNQMTSKDSVRTRLDSDNGLSFTEFSYMLLQAHDFAWLSENEGCEMQMGGSDQWGNITLGIDLIRRRYSRRSFALTWPLLTKPDGSKYGKTAGGDTMWLSASRMSPYRFYQSWIQVDDDEVGKLLSQLTLLPVTEVEQIVAEHQVEPHRRLGQQRLAWEITALVHGADAANAAVDASGVIFGGGAVSSLSREVLATLALEIPTVTLDRGFLTEPQGIVGFLRETGVTASNGEASRLLAQQGISVNDEKISADHEVGLSDLLHGEFLLVRRGKKQVTLVSVKP